MTTIKINDYKGANMFYDNEGNITNNIFIGEYYFSLLSSHQKEALKSLLSRKDVQYQELYLYEDHTLFLTYVSKHGQGLVDIIHNDGTCMTRYANEYINIVDDLIELHDFSKVGILH